MGQVNPGEIEDGLLPIVDGVGITLGRLLAVMDVPVDRLVREEELSREIGRGKQAVVSDFHEGCGKDVEEEASYELFVLERRTFSQALVEKRTPAPSMVWRR